MRYQFEQLREKCNGLPVGHKVNVAIHSEMGSYSAMACFSLMSPNIVHLKTSAPSLSNPQNSRHIQGHLGDCNLLDVTVEVACTPNHF